LTRTLTDRLAAAVGTGAYSGYFPIFPGTAGSVAGIALYVILAASKVLSYELSLGWVVTLTGVFAIGVPAAHRCEAIYGPDDKRIVIDEIWGMLIALFLLPVSWKWILAGFVLFRFFDVIKPFPGRHAERMSGGLAVMLDDGIAGLYTVAILHIVRVLVR
jgi:phosphatidylglycerophosphatase A